MGEVVLAVGTAKALFVVRSSKERTTFRLSEPMLAAEEVASAGADSRGEPPRLFVGATNWHWGSMVRQSDDLGRTWSDPDVGNVKFPEGEDATVTRIWQVQPAGPSEPDVVYAGVEPAALFRSEDRGETFSLVRGLWDHPHRPQWPPGGGGLCLHSIVVHPDDPRRIVVGISAAGVYRTADGGATWEPSNGNIAAAGSADPYPEFGQCVHRLAADPLAPDIVYLQSHGGLYRSDDFGASWKDVENGIPSNFGFPLAVHPSRGGVAYVIPLCAGESRWPIDGKLAVYRTADSGGSWERLDRGLPSRSYFSVLRDAMCTDRHDPAGIYFGTRSGEVFASVDEGESWKRIATRLPGVLSVRALSVD